jgi:hypothetical protein
MIKCDKEIYKLLQDNDIFKNQIKELKELNLNMEITKTNKKFSAFYFCDNFYVHIKIFNFMYNHQESCCYYFFNLGDKSFYTNRLNELKVCLQKEEEELIKNKNKNLFFGKYKVLNKEKAEEIKLLRDDIEKYEVFLDEFNYNVLTARKPCQPL